MNGKILIDTSAIVEHFRGTYNLSDLNAAIYIPVIAIGELLYGAKKSSNEAKHNLQVLNFQRMHETLIVSSNTSKIYADVKNELRLLGRPIPENDIWIASLAIEHNLQLLTKDAHFEEVKDLIILPIK